MIEHCTWPKTVARTLCAGSILLALATIAGCPDESADMAQQLASGGGRQRPAGQAPAGGREARTPAGAKAEQPGVVGAKPDAAQPGLAGQEGEAAAEASPEETGPQVDVKLLNVKSPAPRFTGEGYYSFDVEVLAHEVIPTKVWQVIALNDAGEELGKIQQLMVMIPEKPKIFTFKSFYCKAMPTQIKLVYTEKDARTVAEIEASEGDASHGGAPGAGLGGGSGNKGAGGGGSAGGSGGEDEGAGAGGDE